MARQIGGTVLILGAGVAFLYFLPGILRSLSGDGGGDGPPPIITGPGGGAGGPGNAVPDDFEGERLASPVVAPPPATTGAGLVESLATRLSGFFGAPAVRQNPPGTRPSPTTPLPPAPPAPARTPAARQIAVRTPLSASTRSAVSRARIANPYDAAYVSNPAHAAVIPAAAVAAVRTNPGYSYDFSSGLFNSRARPAGSSASSGGKAGSTQRSRSAPAPSPVRTGRPQSYTARRAAATRAAVARPESQAILAAYNRDRQAGRRPA